MADMDAAATPAAGRPPGEPEGPIGVGLVVPYDFALDRELWRWVPPRVTLHLTRTPYSPLPVGIDQARVVGAEETVQRCATELLAVEPNVVGYACTSGSFVRGRAGERALRDALLRAGARRAVTTSGALAQALSTLGLRRVVAATPYGPDVDAALVGFLAEHAVEVVGLHGLGLTGHIWRVPADATEALVRAAVADARRRGARPDGVVVSCTNLTAYDVITALEEDLDMPVVTANQVTIWGALRALEIAAVGPGQRLLQAAAPRVAPRVTA